MRKISMCVSLLREILINIKLKKFLKLLIILKRMNYFRRFLIVFVCGIVQILVAASYYLGDKKANNILYDEYTALRYYKIAAFAWLTFGVLLTIFSFGDYKEYKNG